MGHAPAARQDQAAEGAPAVASYLPSGTALGPTNVQLWLQLVKLPTERSEAFFEVRGVAGLSELVDMRFE